MSKLVTMQFDKAGVDMILDGLDELPHKRVRKFYDAVLNSAVQQMNAPEQVQAEEAEPAPLRRVAAGRLKKGR